MPEIQETQELPVVEVHRCELCECRTNPENVLCDSCNYVHESCAHCDTRLRTEHLLYANNLRCCVRCYSERYHLCPDCSNVIAINVEVCPSCLANRRECSICHRHENYGRGVETRGQIQSWVCHACYDDHTYSCECGHYHMNDTPCYSRRPPLPTPKESDKDCFLPLRVFALELETNIRPPAPTGWTGVEDGSIEGLEYLTGPIVGNDAVRQIVEGCDFFSSFGDEVVNYKCGFHLHVNAIDKTEDELMRFCHMVYMYQSDFFSLVPHSRIDVPGSSSYCKPLPERYHSSFYFETLKELVYDTNFEAKKYSKYFSERYYWVNMHSYFYRGTVEIRLHSGTVNKEKVLCWVELWLRFFEYACANTYQDIPFFEMLEAAKVQESTINFYKSRQLLFNQGFE